MRYIVTIPTQMIEVEASDAHEAVRLAIAELMHLCDKEPNRACFDTAKVEEGKGHE